MMLADYLRAAAARPFAFGSHDCCTFPGDWVLAQTGFDPVAKWRGRYDSEEGARNFILSAGGIAMLWADGLDGIAQETSAPQAGDIGIIEMPCGEAGGIFTGKRWAFLSNRGVHYASIEPQAVQVIWCLK